MQLVVMLAAAMGSISACSDGVCGDVSISQGIYGRVTYQSDVGNPPPVIVANESIQVLDMGNDRHIVATAVSNANGTFQLDLASGTYVLCASPGVPCVEPVVSDGLVRADLHKGFLSYWDLVGSDCSWW